MADLQTIRDTAAKHGQEHVLRFFDNLPCGQYYRVAVDEQEPYHLYGGLQDSRGYRYQFWQSFPSESM